MKKYENLVELLKEINTNYEVVITPLGVGSQATKKFFHTNMLINDDTVIDFGSKGPDSLYALGKNSKDINNYIITHIHGDHVGGLEENCFLNHYAFNHKPNLYIAEELVDILWENTLKGSLGDLKEGPATLETFFNVHPFKNGEPFYVDGMRFDPIRTVHISEQKPSYSFVIEGHLFYSGDMEMDEELLLSIQDFITIYMHDCQLYNAPVHAQLTELSKLPEDIRKRMYVMHYGDNIDSFRFEIEKLGFKILQQHKTYTL